MSESDTEQPYCPEFKWTFPSGRSLNARLTEYMGEWVIAVGWREPKGDRISQELYIHLADGPESLEALAKFVATVRRRCEEGEPPFGPTRLPPPDPSKKCR